MTTIRILASATPREGCISLAGLLAANNVPLTEAVALYKKVAAGEEAELSIQHDVVAKLFRAELDQLNCEYLTVVE